jgi:hypothetical protein
MIRYYFHIDPDTLSDQQWAILIEDLRWIREKENQKKGMN